MGAKRDMVKGSSQPKVDDGTLIEAVRESDEPFVTAPELSESLGLSTTWITQRLHELRERGIVERKVCGSGQGWWLRRR